MIYYQRRHIICVPFQDVSGNSDGYCRRAEFPAEREAPAKLHQPYRCTVLGASQPLVFLESEVMGWPSGSGSTRLGNMVIYPS